MVKDYTQLIRHNGNKDLFRAVEMSVLSLQVNQPLHIHAEGLRGTGKTTIMRAARQVLPLITRIKGCRYNCDPARPHCPEHAALAPDEVMKLGAERIPMPFLEISHSAKVGTVVGSIDLARLSDPNRPAAALLPGTIPQAHRGIIFVDEINRLADTSPELADILLDVMGTKPGRVQIEETGLPHVQIPVQIAVWAASNPDEEPGPLEHIRRQLSDRFDLVISMARPTELDVVRNILEQSQSFRENPRQFFIPDPAGAAVAQQLKLTEYADKCRFVTAPEELKHLIATIYVDFGLESLRTVEAMELGAKLHAVLNGRTKVTYRDLAAVVPGVLGHRVDVTTLSNILKFIDNAVFATGAREVNSPVREPEQSVLAGTPGAKSAGSRSRSLGEIIGNAVSCFREKLVRTGCARQEPAGKTGTGGAGFRGTGSARGSGHSGASAYGAGGPGKLSDPLNVPLTAPPNKAKPLKDLSVEKYVQGEEASRR